MSENTKSKIKLTGLQVKSLEKLKLLSNLLDTMEKEFGIKSVRIVFDDCFICPDINLDKLGNKPMDKLLKEII